MTAQSVSLPWEGAVDGQLTSARRARFGHGWPSEPEASFECDGWRARQDAALDKPGMAQRFGSAPGALAERCVR